MRTLYEIYRDLKAVTAEKNRLRNMYLTDEWNTFSREKKDRLGDALIAANQSIAILYTSLINRPVKINKELTNHHFFYIDTVGRIADIDDNRILFRAEGMSKEHGLAWLPVLCLDFIEEVEA